MPRMRAMKAIERVIEEVGSVSALAVALGVKSPTVFQWKSGDRPVPPRLALLIEQRWPAVATAQELRPDVFGQPEAQADAA